MGDQPRHEQIDERKYNKCEDVKTKGALCPDEWTAETKCFLAALDMFGQTLIK